MLSEKARINVPNTWSRRAVTADQKALEKSWVEYENAHPSLNPWNLDAFDMGESDEETDYEQRKRRRRRECLRIGKWKKRTVSSESWSIHSSERGGERGVPTSTPLEEHLEGPVIRTGAKNRGMQGPSPPAAPRATDISSGLDQTTLMGRLEPGATAHLSGTGAPMGREQPHVFNPFRLPRDVSLKLSTGPASVNLVGPHLVYHNYLDERDGQ